MFPVAPSLPNPAAAIMPGVYELARTTSTSSTAGYTSSNSPISGSNGASSGAAAVQKVPILLLVHPSEPMPEPQMNLPNAEKLGVENPVQIPNSDSSSSRPTSEVKKEPSNSTPAKVPAKTPKILKPRAKSPGSLKPQGPSPKMNDSFDKSRLRPCPVLRPTMEEFDNPIAYLSRPDICQLGSQFGIVKVVPPTGWRAPFSISKQFKFHTRFQKLSELGIISRSRKFFTDNLNRYLKMHNQPKVRSYINCRNGKRVHYYDLYLAVQKLGVNSDNLSDHNWKSICQLLDLDTTMAQLLKYEFNSKVKAYSHYLSSCSLDNILDDDDERPEEYNQDSSSDNDNTSDSNEVQDGENKDADVMDDYCMVCHKNDNPSQTLLCDNCDDAYHMYCLDPPLKAIPDNDWFCKRCLVGDGAYGFEENIDHKYTITEFIDSCVAFEKQFVATHNNNVPLTVDNIEQKFWHFVNLQRSDITVEYGADIHHMKQGEISGFPMAEKGDLGNALAAPYVNHAFNLTKLLYASGSLLNHIRKTISGMTIPWIYIGSLLLTFCWHVEDHFTLSANYCHFGATKKWYGIPSYHASKFEALMKECAPDLFQRQPDLLHQLVSLLSPMVLADHGIDVVYCDQNPNEYVITYPKVYHAGFNCGFNFNEAVNFTMDAWLPFGEDAVKSYRAIRKENVFDHYKLLENVLKDYLYQPLRYSNKLSFIRGSLDSFDRYLDEQIVLSEKLLSSGIANEKFIVPDLNQPEDPEQDDPICGLCRTCISFQYCLIDNRSHNFGQGSEGVTTTTTILKNSQLLTPEVTPKEVVKREATVTMDLSSSQRLGDVTSDVYDEKSTPQQSVSDLDHGIVNGKLCVMREYDALIESAKREAEDKEQENGAQRRKSRRLEQKKKEPQVEISVNVTTEPKPEKTVKPSVSNVARNVKPGNLLRASTLKLLNEHDVIKVCLQCVGKLHDDGVVSTLPVGSKIVEEQPLIRLKQFTNYVRNVVSR